MLVRLLIEFEFVLFWFICWQLIAYFYKKFLTFLNAKFGKDFDRDI